MLSIKSRILSIVLLSLTTIAVIIGLLSWQNYKNVEKQTFDRVRNVVEASVTIIDGYHQKYLAGEMTENAARSAALEVLSNMKYENDNYIFVLDTNHHIVMLPIRPDYAGQDLTDFKDKNGLYTAREWVRIAKEGGGILRYISKTAVDTPYVPKVAYSKLYSNWDLVVLSSMHAEHLNKELISSFVRGGVFLIIAGGVVGFVSLKVARSVIEPLNNLAGEMTKLASGNTSTSIKGMDRKDEIGPMANAVLAFQDSMIEREKLENKNKETEQFLTNRQHEVDRLIDKFQEETHKDFLDIATHANELKTSSQELRKSAAETDDRSTRASEVSNDTSTNVQTVAAAAEELSASVSEIHGNVQTNYDTIVQTSEKSKTANVQVRELAEAVAQISDVVDLIADIAEQTNLLALNATIEAARAGDAGKGFAVVATEVKQLADQTARATNEIGGQINLVQGSTEQTVTSIESVTSSMDSVLNAMHAISSAVEEQGAATNEISRNASYAAKGTQEVVDNSRSVTKVAQTTNSSAISVESVSDELSRKTEQMQVRIDGFLKEVANA